jgi:ferrous iron transport protein B
LHDLYPGLPNAQWVALRLLDGDDRVIDAMRTGELAQLGEMTDGDPSNISELMLEPVS